jgi:hypothetical protein
MNRKAVNIMVFGIGLLMLLIRPYIVYQLTGYGDKEKSPVKSSLLQRLIKKKEDRYACHENEAVETSFPKFSFRLPVKSLSSLHFQLSQAFNSTFFTETKACVSLIRPGNHRHSLLSCFRI